MCNVEVQVLPTRYYAFFLIRPPFVGGRRYIGGQGALFKISNEPLKPCKNPEKGRMRSEPPPGFLI
jgi:hypothetical protein